MPHRRRLLPTLLLAASAWLAAGPGGVTLLAAAACRHHPSHAMPTGGSGNAPCFCDHMTGGGEIGLAPAQAAPPIRPAVPLGPVADVAFPIPPSFTSGLHPAPIPPPPNPLA